MTDFRSSNAAVTTATKELNISRNVLMEVEPLPVPVVHRVMLPALTHAKMQLKILLTRTTSTPPAKLREYHLSDLAGTNCP